MKANLVGIRSNVRFEDNRTGEVIEGTSIYVTYNDPAVVGQIADKFFLKSTLMIPCIPDLAPGQTLDISFNQRGKVVDVNIID